MRTGYRDKEREDIIACTPSHWQQRVTSLYRQLSRLHLFHYHLQLPNTEATQALRENGRSRFRDLLHHVEEVLHG